MQWFASGAIIFLENEFDIARRDRFACSIESFLEHSDRYVVCVALIHKSRGILRVGGAIEPDLDCAPIQISGGHLLIFTSKLRSGVFNSSLSVLARCVPRST